MELNKDHREILLIKLEEFTDRLESEKHLMQKSVSDKVINLLPLHEMNIFILRESIEGIKKAIIENQIDF